MQERTAAGRSVPDDIQFITSGGYARDDAFDPHIHMTSRTTERLCRDGGCGDWGDRGAGLLGPASLSAHVGTFEDYFLSLLGWERFRASQFGVRHFCTLALNPKEANNPKVAQGVIDLYATLSR